MLSPTTSRCLALLSALALPACAQKSSGGSHFSGATGGATTAVLITTTTIPATSEPTTVPATTVAGADAAVDSLTAIDLPTNKLYTNGSSTAETCVNVGFVAKKAGAPAADVSVSFATVAASAAVTDAGRVSPAEVKTDANGLASASYCTGLAPGAVSISGKVGALSTNSAEITVTAKPVYTFEYLRYDGQEGAAADAGAASGSGSAVKAADTIRLNLLDAGPNDCTKIYFKLTKDGTPVPSAEVNFRSQLDYPKGSKLAEKTAAGSNGTDTATGKKYASFTATSSSQGEFAVPVCAGVDLGTIVVSGAFTDEDHKVYTTKSPVVAIDAGLTNFANMSLTYDPKNAKVIRGFFNTNSADIHPFTVKLGARQDGDPIGDYPVQVAAETGKLTVDNNGYPSDDGTVKFTMQALHMINYRPYPVVPFHSVEAQTRCDAYALSLEPSPVLYSTLRKNFRSTLVYMVRGQEHFNDANHNGMFDANHGDGFWDVNQNGVFDAGIDVLTYDWHNDGLFDPASEWFIDLPTPFVDVDENGQYDDGRDFVIGDVYSPPNGKRDNDTLIWKSDVVPIYMGTSPFAMLRGEILSNMGPDAIADTYFADLKTKGLLNAPTPQVFGTSSGARELFGGGTNVTWTRAGNVVTVTQSEHRVAAGSIITVDRSGAGAPNVGTTTYTVTGATATAFTFAETAGASSGNLDWHALNWVGYGSYWRYLYAHDVCGNPPPGETKVEVSFIDDYVPDYGRREFAASIFIQPGDQILEPSRRLLSDGSGGAVAHINFNVSDHKSNGSSYPVIFREAVAACTNTCTGDAIITPGVACGAHSARELLTLDGDTVESPISVGPVATCACHATAVGGGAPIKGVCACPSGLQWIGGKCDVPPP